MKKRLIASITCLCLLLVMLLGSTIAWFTDSEITKSTMTVGKVSIKQTVVYDATVMVMPNDSVQHKVTVENDGNQSAYLRTLFAFEDGNYIDEQGNARNVLDMITLSGANAANIVIPSPKIQFAATYGGKTTLYTVGYYIHAGELKSEAGNDTVTVMESFMLDGAADQNWGLTVGEEYDILVLSQACQVVGMDGYNAAGALDLSFGAITSGNCASWFEGKLDGTVGFAMTGALNGANAVEIKVQDIASAVVPATAVEDPDAEIELFIAPSEYVGSFTVAADQETYVVDVTVSNLKSDNTNPIKVTLRIPAGLNPDTVTLYHNDSEIDCNYDPSTGRVTFESVSFSPFTVVYDAEAEYVPPVVEDGKELPVAIVVNSPKYENVDLPWGDYGQWGPTEGLDSRLEAAYTFSCKDTPEEAKKSPYANWYCDFYVKLNKDLAANQIFLGGNYGDFGWVGFHNGDLTLEANEEIPLLGSVTQNPWTYSQVAEFVGTFICGVGDVNDALNGATFTVMLRLTNPEDETEFYNVATIEYTFVKKPTVNDMASLKAALAAGEKEIVITNNITLTEGLNAADVTFIGEGVNAGINFNGHNIGGSGTITYKNLNLTTISLPKTLENGERYGWYGGIDYLGHSVANYENCTITGVFTTYSKMVNATNCIFNYYVQDGEEYYGIFMYSSGTVNATNCTFMYGDRAIKIYSEGTATFELNIEGGKFVATDNYTVNKPLINVDSTFFTSATINIKGIEIDSKLADVALHNAEGNAKVTVTIG